MRQVVQVRTSSRCRLRTRSANLPPVRTQNAYQPCVPICVLAVRNLRSYCAVQRPLLRLERIHGGRALTRLKCVNMLREALAGRASRIDQVRDGRARSTARNTPPELGASLTCGCSANWSLMVVTARVSNLELRQSVDTWVDTGRFRPRADCHSALHALRLGA